MHNCISFICASCTQVQQSRFESSSPSTRYITNSSKSN